MRDTDIEVAAQPMPNRSGQEPLHLKTWDEVEVYFKKHLTPHHFGPKGQPVYAQEDIRSLNVILPEDF